MGFDAITHMLSIKRYFGQNEYGRKEDSDGFWGIPDELFLNYCAKNFGQLKEPFFASVFTLSSHHPYILPEKYENSFQGGPNPLYKCIEYSDFSLREFFREASKQPWYKNTLFVLTADHSLPSNDHREYITSTGLFSIPVIFHQPNSNLVGMDSTLVQQIDIFPTVMGYLKYDAPFFASTKDAHVTPYVIPGLGYTATEVPFDFSVTVAYRIPLIKTKTMPKTLKSARPKRSDSDKDEELDPNDPNNPNNNTNGNRSGQMGRNNQVY